MTNTTLDAKSKRVMISLTVEAGEKLLTIRGKVAEELGFKPSMTQIVEFLASKYNDNQNKEN
jgi:hypothetical protein